MSKGSKRTSEVGGAGRWSAKRKVAAVLRLMKGEDLDTVSRELRVTASTLSEWREVFLANGLAGLKSRELDGRDEQIAALKKALGENALDLAISREIIRAYERKAGPLAPGKSTS
jgi:transposase